MHKDIKKILKIIKSFNLGSFWITTNGFFLNDELLDLISNLGYSLVLSLHSTNQDTRKRLMGYKEVIDVKGLVENILARNIELRPSIVALKETILNGDLKSTLLYLREKGIKPRILSNLFDVHGSKAKAENIGYDNNLLVGLLNEWGLCDYVELESSITQKRILDFANLFRDYLTKFDKESKILGLYPDFFFSALESSLQGVRNVHVVGLRTNIEGNAKLNTSWSRSLPIDTFLDVLKTNHEFDTVIIPKCSFNLFMDDIKGQNINGLVSKIDKKVILFG